MSGLKAISQFVLTALFALSISFVAFSASFAEVPQSTYMPAAILAE